MVTGTDCLHTVRAEEAKKPAWEADTVVSGQGKSRACFATLAERKTRFYIAVKMPDRRAETMENAIVAALSAFPSQLVKTILPRSYGTSSSTPVALSLTIHYSAARTDESRTRCGRLFYFAPCAIMFKNSGGGACHR